MMKVKIKAKGRRYFIPVPYALLHLFIGVVTSKRILAIANRSIEKGGNKKFQIPNISRDDLKPLLRELSDQKGLMLVETILKDGTEVSIKL
ncbi:hypothetical protein [Bacillus sp. 1NLA3E]|uniref:hypothetical protein n=1 Tax=Bacillus sp. 1NLA3E TaxID=666686 RepID=UPI0002F099C3|nr:hypothetical protein [Bacillus sp. 1NLA3E]AGK52277.1 hypothetical protein B1NLA3E_02465 [Bacillus sp. 1NLA3E]